MFKKIAIVIVAIAVHTTAIEAQELSTWKNILSFRPTEKVQKAVQARGKTWTVHRMSDASGRVNLDYYPIVIKKMPTIGDREVTATELLEHVRKNLNKFINTSFAEFEPYEDADKKKWDSDKPNSSLLLIQIKLIPKVTDLALVVTSQDASNEWRFSTVRGGSGYKALNDRGNPGAHPVTGNRAFGFYKNEDNNGWTFYTIGADRATRPMDQFFGVPGASDIGFKQGDKLWRSFQEKLVTFVKSNGGVAEINATATVSKRHDWDAIKHNKAVYDTSDQPSWVPVP